MAPWLLTSTSRATNIQNADHAEEVREKRLASST